LPVKIAEHLNKILGFLSIKSAKCIQGHGHAARPPPTRSARRLPPENATGHKKRDIKK
jgi:hypothetical protein